VFRQNKGQAHHDAIVVRGLSLVFLIAKSNDAPLNRFNFCQRSGPSCATTTLRRPRKITVLFAFLSSTGWHRTKAVSLYAFENALIVPLIASVILLIRRYSRRLILRVMSKRFRHVFTGFVHQYFAI